MPVGSPSDRRPRRGLFEEYLDRRSKSRPDEDENQPQPPPDRRRRLNLILRYLGVILPLALSYFGLLYFGAQHNEAGFWTTRAVAAAVWAGFTSVLVRRGDAVGAVTSTAFYAFLDGWMWFASTA
jgi:hypothetical protein